MEYLIGGAAGAVITYAYLRWRFRKFIDTVASHGYANFKFRGRSMRISIRPTYKGEQG